MIESFDKFAFRIRRLVAKMTERQAQSTRHQDRGCSDTYTSPGGIPIVTMGHPIPPSINLSGLLHGALFDLDGVLKGNHERRVKNTVIRRLVTLVERRVHIGIVSGRPEQEIHKLVTRRILDEVSDPDLRHSIYIFEQNGAFGFRAVDRQVISKPRLLDKEDVASIKTVVRRLGRTLPLLQRPRIFDHHSCIYVCFPSASGRTRLAQVIRREIIGLGLRERYSVLDAGADINIVRHDVDKSAAAKAFAHWLGGVPQECILKIGDQYQKNGNDSRMLALPGGVGVDSPDATCWLLDNLLDT